FRTNLCLGAKKCPFLDEPSSVLRDTESVTRVNDLPASGAPQSSTPPRTETRLGKYRLLAVLGRGGMADVYLAVVQGIVGFNKLLVVKEMRLETADDDLREAMFLDEARLAARLNHPSIVQTIEVGSDGHRRVLAMEYLD